MDKIYVHVVVKVQNGDYSYEMPSVHAVQPMKDISDELLAKAAGLLHAKEYYGNRVEEDNTDIFYFQGGEVATALKSAVIIPKEHYEILKQYLP